MYTHATKCYNVVSVVETDYCESVLMFFVHAATKYIAMIWIYSVISILAIIAKMEYTIQ